MTKKIFFIAAIIGFFLFLDLKKAPILEAAPTAKYIKTFSGDIYVDHDADFGVDTLSYLSYNHSRGKSGILFHKTGRTFEGSGSGSEADPYSWSDVQVGGFNNTFFNDLNDIYNLYFGRVPTGAVINTYGTDKFCEPSSYLSGYYLKSGHGGKLKIDNCPGDMLTIPSGAWYMFFVKRLDSLKKTDLIVEEDAVFVVIAEEDIKIDLEANQKIKVEKGGFAAFIAGKNIDIDKQVTGGISIDDPDISGVFLAGGEFKTGDKDTTLYLDGIFIAKKFNLERKDPGEVFIYRPEFLLLAPNELKEDNGSFWQMSNP